jgi:hypothetical protein
VDKRQLRQPPRDPDVLTGRPRRKRAAPGKPLGAGAAARFREAAPTIELADELEPAARPRVDVRGERGDLVLELVERDVVEVATLGFGKEHVFILDNEPDNTVHTRIGLVARREHPYRVYRAPLSPVAKLVRRYGRTTSSARTASMSALSLGPISTA